AGVPGHRDRVGPPARAGHRRREDPAGLHPRVPPGPADARAGRRLHGRDVDLAARAMTAQGRFEDARVDDAGAGGPGVPGADVAPRAEVPARERWRSFGAPALAVVTIAALCLGTLLGWLVFDPHHPGDDSAEAGFARDMSEHHAQA